MHPFRVFPIFVIILSCTLGGCTTAATLEKQAKQKEETKLKKQHYVTLSENIKNRTLIAGTSQTEIRETYGKPDDVFHSGSGDSSFEIWTYEQITTGKEEAGDPLRLYFNDGKLVSWKY